MWLNFTNADLISWQQVASFAKEHVLPNILTWDNQGYFPHSFWETLGKNGYLGLTFPKTMGGAGGTAVRLAATLDAFAYGGKDLGIVNSWGIHSAMVGMAISRVGTKNQQRKYLPAMASGEIMSAFALTEPDAGSDISSIETTARRYNDEYVISGRKAFVTNAPQANLFLVVAKIGTGSSHDFTAFLVDRDTQGLVIGPAQTKSCIRTSQCADIELHECRISAQQRLGADGQAFETIVFPALNWDRCVVWAGRLGRLRTILEDSVVYAKQRHQFGKPIWQHQAVQFKIADMKRNLEAAEMLLSCAASNLQCQVPVRVEAAIARLFLGEATGRAANDAAQIFGAKAFYPKYHVERYYRDAKLDGIGGGTDEIQRLIIGRSVVDSVTDRGAAWMSSCVLPRSTDAC